MSAPIRAMPMTKGPSPCPTPVRSCTRDIAAKEWRRLRALVIDRDGCRCVYCGAPGTATKGPDGEAWHVDHVLPILRGGATTLGNLALACMACNIKKGTALPESPWRARSAYLATLKRDREARRATAPVGYRTFPRPKADATRDAIWAALHALYADRGIPLTPTPIARKAGFSTCAVVHHLRIAALNGHVRQHEKPLRFEPLRASA